MHMKNLHDCSKSNSKRCYSLLISICLLFVINNSQAGFNGRYRLEGTVIGNNQTLANYQVKLYASYANNPSSPRLLGTDISDINGHFKIKYKLPFSYYFKAPVFYVTAEHGKAMLASAIGKIASTDAVVINELTTVAMGTSFAQFINGFKVQGNRYGMSNAVMMAANMADPKTGNPGEIISNTPNGQDTSTYRRFNSMANMVASCIEAQSNCTTLFQNTTVLGAPPVNTVLQAIANMTRLPAGVDIDGLFNLAQITPIYQPTVDETPSAWLLFIKFTGGFYKDFAFDNLMSGPGNIAFDKRGFAWINDNYVPTPELTLSCAGQRLMKFYPWGQNFPGSPFFGGGLSGAGFGISIDPKGKIWVGNFGFEAPGCTELPPIPEKKIPATHNSVSVFRPNGQHISGENGFTNGKIWWPQATVADPKGNIWIANCGNDTVTLIPKGKPSQAQNIILPDGQGAMGNFEVQLPDEPLLKPFAITISPLGDAYVTGNKAGFAITPNGLQAGRVYRITSDGIVEKLPHTTGVNSDESAIFWPMGISSDSQGNIWVSNSDAVNVPCVTPLDPQDGPNASIALYPKEGGYPTKYTGGGITLPWGNAVDGNDTLWVFNFGTQPTRDVDENSDWPDTGVSHFCGANESKCPMGKHTGDPISPPETGYDSDALDRITGGGIDPSGNLWLLNNWKKDGPFGPVYDTNPGGNSFVIVPGAAAPVKTPLIGPPESFDAPHKPNHQQHDFFYWLLKRFIRPNYRRPL